VAVSWSFSAVVSVRTRGATVTVIDCDPLLLVAPLLLPPRGTTVIAAYALTPESTSLDASTWYVPASAGAV
jgi:hypothetical protein